MVLNCGAGEDSESPLDSKEINPVNLKGNQPWIFIGRNIHWNADTEIAILWPPDVKSQLIGEDDDAGKDWRQKKGFSRGWDSWMANSGRWWRTEKPGVLLSVGSPRVEHDWATEKQQPIWVTHTQRRILGIQFCSLSWRIKNYHMAVLLEPASLQKTPSLHLKSGSCCNFTQTFIRLKRKTVYSRYSA